METGLHASFLLINTQKTDLKRRLSESRTLPFEIPDVPTATYEVGLAAEEKQLSLYL